MAESWQRQHALAWRALDAAPVPTGVGVALGVEPPVGQLCLRGDARGKFASVVESQCGMALPLEANTVAGGNDRGILWLGPDEWLVVCPSEDVAALLQSLQQALATEHALVSDVSHSRVRFNVQGARARDVLNKGCSLDLDPRAFGAGRCAQTALARAHMLLHQIDDSPRFHVYAHRSFADYLWTWLVDATLEYR